MRYSKRTRRRIQQLETKLSEAHATIEKLREYVLAIEKSRIALTTPDGWVHRADAIAMGHVDEGLPMRPFEGEGTPYR